MATPAGPTPAAAADDEELGMSVSSSVRPVDMSTFAAQSEHELKVGGGHARYSLNLFGDTYANAEGGPRRAAKQSFGVGGFSMLFTGALENGIRFTAEPLVEFPGNAPAIDLERLHVRWTWKGFFVEAGRTHLDVGYWNVAYHHGKWLQPTIERPRILRFEDDGGLLPIHWIGLTAGYTFELGAAARLLASASVGNSRGSIVDDLKNSADTTADKQLSAKLELKGVLHRELRVGVSGVRGKIAPQGVAVRPVLPDQRLLETIGNVYIALPADPLFAIAEGYAISHEATTRSWQTYAAFVTLGYAVHPRVTPYLRAERLVTTAGVDPFFVPDPAAPAVPELDVVEGIAGVRLDVSTWSAIKVEYQLTRLLDVRETYHTTTASWQFAL